MPELVIDADGHVLEPPDVWQRYVDPAYRGRAIQVRRGDDGRDVLEVDGRPARLTTAEMLGGFGGMGKPMEELAQACLAGRYAESAPAAAVDPAARLALLDRDGIDAAILYPSLGLQWEAEVSGPAYALAHCRAYNRWIEELAAGSGGRLVPIAHLSLGHPRELARLLGRPHGCARARAAARHAALHRAAEQLRAPAVLDLRRPRRAGPAADHRLRRRRPLPLGDGLPAQRPRRGVHGGAARARRGASRREPHAAPRRECGATVRAFRRPRRTVAIVRSLGVAAQRPERP